MSAIVKTDAIVLRAIRYGESSKIVTFFTRSHGKVTVIAKGALRPKSGYGSSLEPMSHASVIFHLKDTREIQTLTQSDLVESWRRLSEDLGTMSSGMKMIELVNAVSEHRHEGSDLFTLLVDGLSRLNDATKDPQISLYIFESRLAGVLGYAPDFTRCAVCRREMGDFPGDSPAAEFHLDKGGVLCTDCSGAPGHRVSLSIRALGVLRLISAPRESAPETDAKTRAEIEAFLWSYLKFHIPGLKEMKTARVFTKIEQR